MNTVAHKRGGRPRGDAPSPVDIHVGSRMKQRRVMMGLSQDKLAKEVGLTFQQIQKYEKGTNRIGASRLHDFSQALDVPVSFFFDELSAGVSAIPVGGFGETPQDPFEMDPMSRRETVELVRAYSRITDPLVRKRIGDMVKAVAAATAVPTRRKAANVDSD